MMSCCVVGISTIELDNPRAQGVALFEIIPWD